MSTQDGGIVIEWKHLKGQGKERCKHPITDMT